MMNCNRIVRALGVFGVVVSLTGSSLAAVKQNFVAATSSNNLLLFDNATTAINAVLPITGLRPGESLLGIDYRPSTSELYGLGSTSRIYRLNTTSGSAVIAVSDTPLQPLLNGTAFGFDFDPRADLIQIVSDTGQNLRVDPDTGKVKARGQAPNYSGSDVGNGQTPFETAIAFDNNRPKTGTSKLFGLDTNLGVLVQQTSPARGTLVTIGFLNVPATQFNGFDIVENRRESLGFAVLEVTEIPGTFDLYSVNLVTGQATFIRNIISGPTVRVTGLAAVPDDDGDSILDAFDACPGTKTNDLVTSDGCTTTIVDYSITTSSLVETCKTSSTCSLKIDYAQVNFGASNGGKTTVEFFLSTDAVFDGGDPLLKSVKMKLKGSQIKDKKLKIKTASSSTGKFVIAVVDRSLAVDESDEGNNQVVFGPVP